MRNSISKFSLDGVMSPLETAMLRVVTIPHLNSTFLSEQGSDFQWDHFNIVYVKTKTTKYIANASWFINLLFPSLKLHSCLGWGWGSLSLGALTSRHFLNRRSSSLFRHTYISKHKNVVLMSGRSSREVVKGLRNSLEQPQSLSKIVVIRDCDDDDN